MMTFNHVNKYTFVISYLEILLPLWSLLDCLLVATHCKLLPRAKPVGNETTPYMTYSKYIGAMPKYSILYSFIFLGLHFMVQLNLSILFSLNFN